MSGMIKYRVHEVGKDFGKTSKEITQILTDYATTPKNHMQVLDDRELSIIFEYLTQHNQVADLQSVFANAPATKPESKGDAHPGKEKDKAEKKDRPAGSNKPADRSKAAPNKEKQQSQQQPKAEEPKANATRVPAKKLVDTRKAGNVNLDKYDERLENMAPERANKMQGGKQKVQSGKQRRGANCGNKRKQEEQRHIKKFEEDPKLEILKGRYGPYIVYDGNNYRMPKNLHAKAADLTLEQCMEIVNTAPAKKK